MIFKMLYFTQMSYIQEKEQQCNCIYKQLWQQMEEKYEKVYQSNLKIVEVITKLCESGDKRYEKLTDVLVEQLSNVIKETIKKDF